MSWINGNGFIPNEGLNESTAPWLAPAAFDGAFPPGSPANVGYGATSVDGVRPAWFGGGDQTGSATGPWGGGGPGLFAQFANAVQQLANRFGIALPGGAMSAFTGGSQGAGTSFQNVSLASTGDPHLSVTGSAWNGGGTTADVDAHFDSMAGHADLFSTGAFGGLNVATAVTTPNANGVTQNASATATMDGGLDSVTLTNAGTLSVVSGGAPVSIAPGQSVTLAGGETVSENGAGAVTISEQAYGASLTTTFARNGGGGVDVTAQGHDVTLGGDLIAGANPVAQTQPAWRQTQGYV